MSRRAAKRPQPAGAWALVFIAMAGHPANAQTPLGAALVSRIFASWNQTLIQLRFVDSLRQAA